MGIYRVTACWYETVEVEAENEDDAIDKAYKELRSDICRNGTVNDYEVKQLDEDDE